MKPSQPEVEHFCISVMPPLSEEQGAGLPLPYMEGAYGPEYIRPWHVVDNYTDSSLLAYPKWTFGRDPKQRSAYVQELQSRLGDGHTVRLTSFSKWLPEQIVEPVRKVEPVPKVESVLEVVPRPEQPLYSVPSQTIKLISCTDAFVLALNPPLPNTALTSWLWPNWHNGPAEVQEGLNGNELHVYKYDSEQPDGLTIGKCRAFAEMFKQTIALEFGEYALDPDVACISAVNDLLAKPASQTVELAA